MQVTSKPVSGLDSVWQGCKLGMRLHAGKGQARMRATKASDEQMHGTAVEEAWVGVMLHYSAES